MAQKGIDLASSSGGICTDLVQFPARLDAVPAVLAYVAGALSQRGYGPGQVARAELLLEELMRNSVLHGYAGASAGQVWVGVQADRLRFQDAAPRFDPLTQGPAPLDVTAAISTLRVGGIGLQLIRQLGSAIQYHYAEGRNCITVSIQHSPEPPSQDIIEHE